MKDRVFEGASVAEALAEAGRVLGLAPGTLPHVVLEAGPPARVAVLLGTPGVARTPQPAARGEVPEAAPVEAEVRALVRELGQAAGVDAHADCERRERGGLDVQLQGDAAFFSAEVVRSLEVVLRGVAARAGVDGSVRVHMEGAEAREEGLRRLAEETARAVVEDGVPRQLPALNSWERRLVHMALSERTGIRTYSSGEGRERTLTVARLADDEGPGGGETA